MRVDFLACVEKEKRVKPVQLKAEAHKHYFCPTTSFLQETGIQKTADQVATVGTV